MSYASHTIRLFTVHLLIASIGVVGLAPVLMQGEESSRAQRGRSPASVQRCCCGTAGGVCCGQSCCGMQKPKQRQSPRRNGNDSSGPILLTLNWSRLDTTVSTDGTRLTRLADELCHPSGVATLQAMHVRLDA